jgi:Protein of unknown function (DUF2510)
MSIPEPTHEFTTPAGWYPTGETGPDGAPAERWWDGVQWTPAIRPLSGGAGGPRRRSRATSLIAAGVIVVLAAAGLGTYFAVSHGGSTSTASAGSQPTTVPTPGNGGLGGGNGGTGDGGGLGGGGTGGTGGTGGGGLGNGGGGSLGGQSASPAPTVTGGSGQTVSDPIDGLIIPVPSGWTATAGSTSGEGTWPALSTGSYTCPSALAQSNGTSATAQCTRGGVGFTTTSGTTAQSVATSDIAALAKSNYGNLTSHSVVSQGALTVAGRAGYQVTWSVVPSYSGPSGTVEGIAVPVPGHSGFFTLIDIGVDQSSQAPSLSSVNSQIISSITDSSAAGA